MTGKAGVSDTPTGVVGRFRRTMLLLLLLVSGGGWSADWTDLDFTVAASLPDDLIEYLRAADGHQAFALSSRLNPFYLQSDFDGDGRTDIAVLIEEKSTGKGGILVVHMGTKEHFVIGAGEPVGSGSDDFNWVDAWQVHARGPVTQSAHVEAEPPVLSGDALLIIRTESSSRLLYWSGTGYDSYQQAD